MAFRAERFRFRGALCGAAMWLSVYLCHMARESKGHLLSESVVISAKQNATAEG